MESLPLLATKFYVPTPRTSHISRSRLLEQLNQGLKGKLGLVSAPAGFGKTTLLSEWIATLQTQVAWLSLDAGDNNLTLFWRYLITALQKVEEDIGATALTALRSGEPPQMKLLLTGLINEIDTVVTKRRSSPLILVLDDYHIITNHEIHEGLFFLLENLPPAIHIVISSRTDPPWSLARLRARQELTELRVRDLRFTLAEVTAFLNDAMDLALLSQDIETLDSRIEGWAAGLQMAALALQGKITMALQESPMMLVRDELPGNYIGSLNGSHRFILDYLVEEVLEQQPEHIQSFLLQTAVLNHLTAELCNAITGQQDSQVILSHLDHANLFIFPLDDERRWYRYHHLFADLLRQRLQQNNPELIPQLHLRASQWYEKQGLIADAVNHALAADDMTQVTRLAEENVLGMLEHGELGHIINWLKALPDDVIHGWPWLCTACAWAFVHSGHFDDAKSCLNQLRAIARDMSDEDNRRQIDGHVNAIHLYIVAMTFVDWEDAVSYAENALALLPVEDMRTRGLVAVLLGYVQRTNHHYTAARTTLQSALSVSKMAGESYATIDLLCQLARVEAQQGQLRLAEKTCHEAIAQAEVEWQIHNHALPVVSYAHATLATVLLERNQLNLALVHAQKAASLSQKWGHFDSWLESQQLLSLIYQASRRSADALAILQNAKQTFDIAADYVARYEVFLYLMNGDLDYVVKWAEEEEIEFTDSLAGYQLTQNLLLARIKIAQYQRGTLKSLDDVIYHLNHLEEQLTSRDARRGVIRTLVLQTMALKTVNQDVAAITVLERALSMAQPEGYILTFIQEGDLMCQMLRQALMQGISVPYVRDLLRAFGQEMDVGLVPTEGTKIELLDPLSKRELEVLRLLATSLNSTEIAGELIIAPSTVRSHIKNIYSKLDVHNRFEAIHQAQSLGLL